MDLLFTNVAYADVDSFVLHVNTLIINPLIVLLFGLAIAYFLYGVFEFISNQENEEKKTTGKSHMLWGIVGIVIMMGVFTILNMIMKTFNIEDINPETGEVTLPDYNP
jgi:phosphotransferase system  glucose/maltose/N-acetylglucosamine-specific IIC component